MRRVLRSGATSLIALCLILSAIWANLAITYQLLGPAGVRIGAYLALDVIALAALLALVLRRRWRAVLICGAAYAIFLAWSSSISASNDKNWACRCRPWLHRHCRRRPARDVRNFSWRTEADYTEGWEQRTYDLSKLRSLDLFLVYWMGPSIAHTIMSFGFEDGRYLDFSIELRREQNVHIRPSSAFSRRTSWYISGPMSAT